MILVDTSIWIDHFRAPDPALLKLLKHRMIFTHPIVIGELLVGGLPDRRNALPWLWRMRSVQQASHDETILFIERHKLWGRGIGYGDIQLVASVLLTRAALLWTNDRKLDELAAEFGIAVSPKSDPDVP